LQKLYDMFLIERIAGSRNDSGLVRAKDASTNSGATAAEGSKDSRASCVGRGGRGRGGRGRGGRGREAICTGRTPMTRKERGKYKCGPHVLRPLTARRH
jgi:hypothetical protein